MNLVQFNNFKQTLRVCLKSMRNHYKNKIITMKFNDHFMQIALNEAKIAESKGEVPVGCIIVERDTGEVVSRAHNMMQEKQNPTLHAEMLAIQSIYNIIDFKFLYKYDIYVTLEPCAMCCSAISNARFGRLYYGAEDTKQGAIENNIRFYTTQACFYKPEIYSGILHHASKSLLKNFFSQLRQNH